MFDKEWAMNTTLNLNTNAPALDPYIRDMQHQPLSEKILNDVYNATVYKLENAGFYKEYDIKLISRYSFNFSILGIEYCTDKSCPDGTLFLLTFSANGTHFITPPYGEGEYAPMSWNEWFIRTGEGEQLSIVIIAPWAQAKFINIDMAVLSGGLYG